MVSDGLNGLKLRGPQTEREPLARRGVVDLAIVVQEISGRPTALADFLQIVLRLLSAAGDHAASSPVPYRLSRRLPARRRPHRRPCPSAAAPRSFPVRRGQCVLA